MPTRLAPRPHDLRRHGFSFVELFVALSLGAVVLLTMADAAFLLGSQVEAVRAQPDRSAEETLAEMEAAVRQAWWVDADATSLRVADPYGGVTEYALDDGVLEVTRPNGEQAELVTDLTGFGVTTQTTRRLREAPTLDSAGTWWSAPAPGAADRLELHDGDAVALGFTVPPDAPTSVNTVAGVEEQLLRAGIDTLTLTASYVDMSPKVFCHLHASPPHNPNHAAHSGTLTFELYEAHVPGDPGPHGPLLASTVVGAQQLPLGTVTWWDTIAQQVENPPNGVAWGWWNQNAHVIPIFDAPTLPVTISLAAMGAVVEPGRAYTLVMRVDGMAEITLATAQRSSAVQSEVALMRDGETTFTQQALEVSRDLSGVRTFTQTAEQQVVTSVTLSLQQARAADVTGSASVAGQAIATDEWNGVVPGELPTLEQSGS